MIGKIRLVARHYAALIAICMSFGWLASAVPVAAQAPDYFVIADVSVQQPYVGQRFSYLLQLYVAQDAPQLPTINAPEFVDLWLVDTIPSRTRPGEYNGRDYNVVIVEYLLYPLRSGSITIEPGSITIRDVRSQTTQTLTSNAISLTVQALPPNAPATFSGAVGSYTVTAQLDRDSIRLGETVLLSLSVSGSGNLEQVDAPILDLPAGWRVYERIPQVERGVARRVNVKRYQWQVIPASTGIYPLRNLAVDYFNPRTQRYERAIADPVTLDVVQGQRVSIQTTETANIVNLTTIKPVPEQFASPIFVIPDWFWYLWALPPVLVLLITIGAYAERQQARTPRQRKRAAYRYAMRQLRRIGRRQEQLSLQIQDVLLNYFRHRSPELVGGLQTDTLQMWMTERGVSGDLQQEIMACIHEAEAAQYAPPGMYRPGTVLSRFRSALRKLENHWQPVVDTPVDTPNIDVKV